MDEATGLLIQLYGILLVVGILVLLKWRRWAMTAMNWLRGGGWRITLDTTYQALQRKWRIGETILYNDNIETVEGAGDAMKHPPKDLERALRAIGKRQYVAPLGWEIVNGVPELVKVSLAGDDVYHILTSGKSRMGKDNAVVYWLLSLALQNGSDTFQVAIIDGKEGLDWMGWQNKAHTALLAINKEDIAPAMQTLTAERERRGELLKAACCSNWEGYCKKGHALPLLVVYIAELSLLEDATSKNELEQWMNAELSAAGAYGIRYVVATQTATNFGTRWRGQIDLFAAGYQPAQSHNTPNTGQSTKELRDRGAIPPSDLPEPPAGRGVFTLVQGKVTAMVRVPYLDDDARQRYLDQLPDGSGTGTHMGINTQANGVVPELVPTGSDAVLTGSDAVPDSELLIQTLVQSGYSRNQIAKLLGGNKQQVLKRIRQVMGEE